MSITEHSPSDVRADADSPVVVRRPLYATQLQKARVDRELSIGDVSTQTKVRPAIIEALERGDVEPSGGIVYARGHVRSLAHALALDPVPLVASFDHAHRDQVSQVAVLAAETDPPEIVAPPRRRRAPGGERRPHWPLLLAVVLVVVIAVALVQLLVPGSGSSEKSSAPPAPRPTAAAPSHKAPVVKPKPAATIPPMAFPVPAQGVMVRIVLPFLPSWMSVTDQNGVALIPPGVQQPSYPNYKALDFKAANGMRVTFGDASAVAMSCNGKALPRPLGASGQVITIDLYRGNAFCPAS
jgi:cytoskeleton protein RodZ